MEIVHRWIIFSIAPLSFTIPLDIMAKKKIKISVKKKNIYINIPEYLISIPLYA